MLKTETDTQAMGNRVLRASRAILKKRKLSAWFEHGQWWIEHAPSGAQWSVLDAVGGSSIDGFCLDQVTEGEKCAQ